MNELSGEYIDVPDALNRVGGNMDLLKRLLKRFIDGNQIDEMDRVLREGNMEEAARQAHTVKGVSANLSLVKLRTVTTELELILKDNLDYSAKLDELKQAYDETVKIIQEITS